MKYSLLILMIALIGCEGPQQRPQQLVEESSTASAKLKATPEIESGVLTGKVIKIVDGDTLDMLTDEKKRFVS